MCIVSTSKEIILGIMRRVYNREGFPDGSVAKKCGFSPWVGKILWRRRWQPTPVFLPGKSHGQRSLASSMGFMELQRAGHGLATK